MLTAFDTTGESRTPAQIRALIPRNPAVVMGYIDGLARWPAGAWSMFPKARKIRISIEANPLADVFDFENGTAGLDKVAQAVELRSAAYLASVVYVSESRWGEAKSALVNLPVAWFIAAWGGPPPSAPMAGAVAWQWFSGPEFDESVVSPSAWPQW